MYGLYTFIFLMLSPKAFGRFRAGRIRPGRFEYPELNGWMLVDTAVEICESDMACAGFTFKGPFKAKDTTFEMYFFHVVKMDEGVAFRDFVVRFSYLTLKFPYLIKLLARIPKEEKYFHWSTYQVQRNYVEIPSMRINENLKGSIEITNEGLV